MPTVVRSSEGLLRIAVDKLPSMIAYWDADGRCRFANAAYERWFGVSPDALLGKHISELLGPIYALNLPHIEAALRGEFQAFEREIPDPAGGRPRHSLANYIPDVVDGKVQGFFVLVMDISEVKLAQLALQESEARFSGIFSTSAEAIISIDEAHRIVLFNPGAEATFGWKRDEIIGRSIDLLIPARFREVHGGHIAGFLADGARPREMGHVRQRISGLRKNGEEFPAEGNISALRIGDRTLFTVAMRDISARRRLEREQEFLFEAGALLASTLDYDRTLQTLADLSVREFADWCVIDITAGEGNNHRLKVAAADPSRAAVSARFEQIAIDRSKPYLLQPVFEKRRSLLVAHITPEYAERSTQSPEHLSLLRDIDPRSLLAVPLLLRGELFGALAFVSSRDDHIYDAHDLRLAEALAERAAAAIENATLYRAAVESTKLRDQVLRVVAHDLRNPLQALMTETSILRRLGRSAAGGLGESAEIIGQAASRMDRLIRDLLDVTTIEAGRLSLTLTRVSAAQIVHNAARAATPLAVAESLTIRNTVAENVRDVWADEDRLMQVFENLIGNAIKFTKPGGQITVGAEPSADGVTFSVVDTGIGIDREQVPHLFDQFWQARQTDRRGAGLGLTIAKGIVTSHGGRIWVESTLGRGTAFFFTIPVARQAG